MPTNGRLDSLTATPDNRRVAAILGIDVGTKTLGLAVSDEGETIAFSLETVQRVNMTRDLNAVCAILDQRESRQAVVGLPLNLDGSRGAMCDETDRFAQALAARGYQVDRADERMTTVSAERALLEWDISRRRRKEVIDSVAAAVMLQAYLDRRKLGADR